jgi:hypothetical protein
MKISEFKKLIREEVQNVVKEDVEKPTLRQMQFLADLKMERLNTPHKVYNRLSKNAADDIKKIEKIYNNLDALITYFTNL